MHGSRSDDLRPHPCGGNGGWRLHAWLSSTPPQKAQGLPERRGWAAKSDQEARLQWPAAPSGRNEEKHPERSEGVAAGHDGPSRECRPHPPQRERRSEEHTSELQSLMRISYAVFGLKKKKNKS